MESLNRISLRRIALARQGLVSKQPFGRGVNATLKAVQHLGYVQIDTISVVARAHHHTLYCRVPNFTSGHIDQLLEQRKIFENRFPVAAFRPIEDYRFTLLHADKFRERSKNMDKALLRQVLDRIRDEGPSRSRDFEHSKKKSGGWWNWKPAKVALEQLYYQGDLMVSARNGFEKSYDLAERVLPSGLDTRKPTLLEFADFLIDSTLRAHGFATYATFAYGARYLPLGKVLKTALSNRVEDGSLYQFVDDQGVKCWAEPGILNSKKLRSGQGIRILSPFDNLVIQRERLNQVFNFDYLIECYVPEPKRQFGYYCLPIIYGDQFVGRMDCKSHRESGCFEIKGLFLEPEFSERSKIAEMASHFAGAVRAYATFDGCGSVKISRTQPTCAKQIVQQALENEY